MEKNSDRRLRKTISVSESSWKNFRRFCHRKNWSGAKAVDIIFRHLNPDGVAPPIVADNITASTPRRIPDDCVRYMRQIKKEQGLTISQLVDMSANWTSDGSKFGRRTVHRALTGEGGYGQLPKQKRRPLCQEKISAVRRLRFKGYSFRTIEQKTGVNRSTCEKVCNRKGVYRWR